MSRSIPHNLAALQKEKERLKAKSKKVLTETHPAELAKVDLSDYDVNTLLEIASLIFYPKKTRNMRIVSLAIPIVFIALNKAKDYFNEVDILKDTLSKVEEYVKAK